MIDRTAGEGHLSTIGVKMSFKAEAEIIVYSLWEEDLSDIIFSVQDELCISKEYAIELVSDIMIEEEVVQELDFS